ncbi:hypothetical protein ACOSQ3_029334 [Xanthoceras sorbifolium]
MLVPILLAINIRLSSHKEVVLQMEGTSTMVEVEVEEEEGMEEDTITIGHHAKFVEKVAYLLQSTAYYATPETVCDSPWYSDSGATNHITSDLGNLTIQSDCRGNDRLVVGNGQQLNVSNIVAKICLAQRQSP